MESVIFMDILICESHLEPIIYVNLFFLSRFEFVANLAQEIHTFQCHVQFNDSTVL